ncbi:MAG: hypothetical protein GXY83_13160 [Rhodopirellula sp.]|nr:hypothetical protein [Rhodopirellula sp.]
MMKIFLARLALAVSVFASGVGQLAAGESFSFGEKDDWTNNQLICRQDGSLGLMGGQLTYSAETFPVDTTAVSKLSGQFKRLPGAGEKDRFFFAFLTFDKDMKRIDAIHVNPVQESDTELAAPCTASDTAIKLKKGSNFTKGSYIAFHTRNDYQDLPNRNVNAQAPITDSKQLDDGTWLVTVKAPIGLDAPAGTRVRAHQGGWYQYSGAFAQTIPDDWTSFEGTIQGSEAGDHRSKWRPGTAYAQLILFGSGPATEPFLAFRNVKFKSTGGAEQASSDAIVVDIPKTTVETSLALLPVRGGQDLKVHFENGSWRTVRITVFDEKTVEPGKETPLFAAGLEIQPFDVRYALRPAASSAGQADPADRRRNRVEEAEIYRKQFILSLRQVNGAVEFRVDGSYIGTMMRDSRADSITSSIPIETVSFRTEPPAGDYVPIDISPKSKPGAMDGARVKLANQEIPFIVAGGANLDMGVTTKQSSLNEGQRSLAETQASFIFTVPCEQYTRAWVLCALEEDPQKDPVLNARLTRYVGGAEYTGRAYEAMANTSVELPGNATRAGDVIVSGKLLPLWRVEIPLHSGNIQDLIFTENRGTHSRMRFGKYLDFELSGRLVKRRGPLGDRRHVPDPAFTSSVHVFGVTLEKPAAELEIKPIQTGNIFHNDEIPETLVEVRPRRQGDFKLRWTIRDAEDQVVDSEERKADSRGPQEFKISLAMKQIGWYGIDFELLDAERVLLTHSASFALLGKDTRKAEVADSPYGTWNYGGPHYTTPDVEIYGPVLFKAGFRRSAGVNRYSEAELAPWKLAVPTVKTGGLQSSDEELIRNIRNSLQRYPSVANAMIFHEHAVWGYQVAPELIGRKPEPGSQWEGAEQRWNYAERLGRILRTHFPQLRVTIGNSLASTELIAEGLRRGFPEAYADFLGLEVVGRTTLPERQWEASLQAGDLMLETAARFGYHKWKINACYESNYRLNAILGDKTQAEWYVRDLLLCQAWGMPDIFIGVIMDTGNSYAGSFWGASGLCTRDPYLYPKKAYVGVALATKMLDQVRLSRSIPTGSPTVYALEFHRKDGKYVYPLWTSRGTADLTLETISSDCEIFDFYGRPRKASTFDRGLALTAGTAATYILANAPLVKSIACGKRTYPEDPPPKSLKVVSPMDNVAEWTLAGGKEPLLERTKGVFMPYRTLGKYAVRQVNDDEKGECIELELVDPDLSLPKIFNEYAVLQLKKPVALDGRPNSLGIWVKGNSGWGQVYWIIEGADGQRRISCGTRVHRADVFDYEGRVSISFDGWNFLSMPITDQSSIPDTSTGSVDNLWEYGEVAHDEKLKRGSGVLAYPIKLVGVAFAAQSRPLFLTERRQHKQIIRFKDVSAFE